MCKTIISALFCFLSAVVPFYSQEKAQTKYFELENGMKVFLYERHTLPLMNMVVAVNLGSKDETEETNGLVHLLEHYILFRGTKSRSSEKISQDIRRHGAYFNAHTGLDMALFEISLPSEYADFALENQKDILFNLKLTQEEIDEEKEVILEEINQIEDDPVKYATFLIYQSLFKNHPYQRPIYGKKEIIKTITVEQMERFYQKYFIPQNCALAIVGDFSSQQIEEKIKKTYGDMKATEFTPSTYEKSIPLKKKEEVDLQMDVNRAYLIIGMIGPDYNHPDQYPMYILTDILSRGINPMLYSIRGRRNVMLNIFMSYIAYKYGGVIIIYITLDPKNIKAVKRQAIQFLKKTRHEMYSKKDFTGESQYYALDYLESAKNLIKFESRQADEEGLILAVTLVRFMLLNEKQGSRRFLEEIDKTSSTDVRKTAGEYFGKGQYVILSILPKEKE